MPARPGATACGTPPWCVVHGLPRLPLMVARTMHRTVPRDRHPGPFPDPPCGTVAPIRFAETHVVPYHTIAFSQQKLRAALRRAEEQDLELHYGFVVHSRRQGEQPSLGIVTLSGESMTLTDRLLAGLRDVPLWLFGHARVTLDNGTPLPGVDPARNRTEMPLSAFQMHIATFDATSGVTKNLVQVEAMVRAETLVQPLLVLAPSRPETWPL